MSLSVVIVTFNSADVVAHALQSIPQGHEIIVVDNASGDDSARIAETMRARVLRLGENLGFGTACNRGAAVASHDGILFLNPDARLRPDTLDLLECAMGAASEAGAFVPRLIHPDGWEHFQGRNPFVDRRAWVHEAPQSDCDVPMGIGAALLVRKDVFERLGGFDESIFLFFEDVDLSARIINAGYTIRYVHDAAVDHMIGASSGKGDDLLEFKNYHFQRALLQMDRKYGRRENRGRHIASQLAKLTLAHLCCNRRRVRMARGRLRALRERDR
ncbi:MAG: glycosyltransferase family 2 protein [Rhodobiaceae bacterium]|nr:glycosyltransferase family 2 protein [Rhodobiaceae bacterium]